MLPSLTRKEIDSDAFDHLCPNAAPETGVMSNNTLKMDVPRTLQEIHTTTEHVTDNSDFCARPKLREVHGKYR
jgi:hypothetical protein